MKERPILFSGQMVQAILDGRKTQTRRVVKPQPSSSRAEFSAAGTLKSVSAGYHPHLGRFGAFFRWADGDFAQSEMIPSPYGKPGDRLWVKETFCTDFKDGIAFRADEEPVPEIWGRWKPSIFMPRALSRLTLEITNIRVERLQEISEEDVEEEGWNPETDSLAPIDWYGNLWDSINGENSWSANPWVWVIDFQRLDHVSTINDQPSTPAYE